MTHQISRQFVLDKLAVVFPDPDVAEQVLKSLDTYGHSEFQPAPEYIHLAILKLCEGRLWRVRELVREAKNDPRDVIYPAETPEYSRVMRELMPDTRGLTAKVRAKLKKELSPSKEAAIRKRDRDQWTTWITSV